MEAQDRDYDIPVEILESSRPLSDTSDDSTNLFVSASLVLAWKSLLMPSWFATAERVQIVSPIVLKHADGTEGEICELRQWESMSGWGVYLLKWVLGIEKQLMEANLKYAEELARFVEGGH